MKQVWKYKIKSDVDTIEVPRDGIIRCIDEQFNEICMWIEVDPSKDIENRYIRVYGTGDIMKEYDIGYLKYIGTVKLNNGEFVFHVYEYTFNL